MLCRFRSQIVILVLSFIAFGVHAGECDDPQSSEQIAQCIGKELRESDAKINSSYKELMGKLNESDKTALRQAQRAWIKDRDSTCRLDTKESNREKWYRAVLENYAKTVCVTRYTRRRTAELDAMLAKSSPQPGDTAALPSPVARPRAAQNPDVAYDKRAATVHSSGKWYYEIAVDYGEAVKIAPFVLTIGVWDRQQLVGILDNIRARDGNRGVLRYGVAIDLDNGKIYVSQNGAWIEGEPGSNLGRDLKLGRNYYATFMGSYESVTPYLEHKALVPNFGGKAMTYALPAGYSPWRNKIPD